MDGRMASERTSRSRALAARSDRRGGPGNFAGIDYQLLVQISKLLSWVMEGRRRIRPTAVIRCEPRELIGDGQLGFDLGFTGRTEAPDELVEVKRAPTRSDVLDLVRRLPLMAASSGHIGLVSEGRTVAFTALEKLHEHGGEAADGDEFFARVEGGDPFEATLFGALGDSPKRAISVMLEPVLEGEQSLRQRVEFMARTLAYPGRDGELTDRLFRELQRGATRRLAIPLTRLVAELEEAGLLMPEPTVAPDMDDEQIAALCVLETCPGPLPSEVLGAALKLSTHEVDRLLAQHVEIGGVLSVDGHYYRQAGDFPLARRHGQTLMASTLAELARWARSKKEGAASQSPNALALARACSSAAPDVVGGVFCAFDKASKAWGDLWVTYELARVSNDAILTLFHRGLSDDDAKRWGATRAQTYICGHGWVLQRVGQLADSMAFMDQARGISEQYHDDENHAFALKCEGRLLRMEAEALPDGEERREKLDQSANLLRAAFVEFERLLTRNSRFIEDRGECVSLLARTLATGFELKAAEREAQRAHELLDRQPGSKALADLVILDAELMMLREGSNAAWAPQQTRRETPMKLHVDRLRTLIESYSPDLEAGFQRAASEIVARAYAVLGQIYDKCADIEPARASYEAAADLYNRLGYASRRDTARWSARILSGEPLPEGLLAALDAKDAEEGARLIALDRYIALSTSDIKAETMTDTPDAPVGDALWIGLVNEAMGLHAAATPRWGEGRTA